MNKLTAIGEQVHAHLEQQNDLREKSIALARLLTRRSANAIHAIHRLQWEIAQTRLEEVRQTAAEIRTVLADTPDIYYSGNTQDALKEYVEAFLTYNLVHDQDLMTPEELLVPPNTYINGLAEAASELRRHILDTTRRGDYLAAERMLEAMDNIYTTLMSFNFPDGVTGGIRHRTDNLRAVLERTRGELTLSLQQHTLKTALEMLSAQLAADA